MKKALLLTLALVTTANAQTVQQSGNVTPGHSACWAITGVIYDCGTAGGSSIVGSYTANDLVAVNGSGSLIDSGINPTATSNISGLWNFNGGATAPTRANGDNTTNVATTAFVDTAIFTTLLSTANTWTALNTFTAGIASTPAVPGAVNNNPGQYNCFIGSTIYCGNTTAISSVAPGFTSAGVSGITIGAPSGAAAAIFGAQCSLGTGVGYLACGPAVQCYVYADTTQANNNGISCGYTAAVLSATSDPVAVGGGRTYGYVSHEFSVVNDWGYVATDPYNYNGNGTVHGMRVDCGIGLGGHNNCGGSAYEVVSNTEQYGGGLLCGQGGLVTSTLFGFSGLSRCVAMADSQGLFWYSAAGTLAAGIFEQVNSTTFLHLSVPTNGALEFDVNGAAIMGWNVGTFFANTTNAVALGGSSLRWSNIFSVLGNFSGLITASAGETVSGTLTLPDSTTWTTSGLSALTVLGEFQNTAARTIVSSAGATLDDINIAPETTTITGSTNITTATGFNKVSLYIPTYADSSAVTITNAATLFIQNAPTTSGMATITNAYALWVAGGKSLFAGNVNMTGLPSTSPGGTVSSICWSTPGGILWTDTSGTICGISAMMFKSPPSDWLPLSPDDALEGVKSLRLAAWQYLPEYHRGSEFHVGPIADDVIAMNPLCGVDGGHNYSDRCVETYLAGSVQALEAKLSRLQRDFQTYKDNHP